MLEIHEVWRKPEISCIPLFEQEGWLLDPGVTANLSLMLANSVFEHLVRFGVCCGDASDWIWLLKGVPLPKDKA